MSSLNTALWLLAIIVAYCVAARMDQDNAAIRIECPAGDPRDFTRPDSLRTEATFGPQREATDVTVSPDDACASSVALRE